MLAYRTRGKVSEEREKMLFAVAQTETDSMIFDMRNHFNRFLEAQIKADPGFIAHEDCWVKTSVAESIAYLTGQKDSLYREHEMAMTQFRDRERRKQAMMAAVEHYSQTMENQGGAIQSVVALDDLGDTYNWHRTP